MSTHTRTFSGSESLHDARSFVVSSLAGTSADALEIISLMVSELATNAALHAGTDFTVNVSRADPAGRLRVEVSDTGAGRPRLRHPGLSEPHGRGLQIVASLADRWGIHQPGGQLGKTVWFEVTEAHLVGPPGTDRTRAGGAETGSRGEDRTTTARADGVSARGAGAGGRRPSWDYAIAA